MIDYAAQRAVEEDVLSMLEQDCVKQARAAAAHMFRLAYGTDSPVEALASFDAAIDEYVVNYLVKAAASDPVFPRFAIDFLPPHDTFGVDFPGARMGGDNPDNLYRVAGIEHGGNYRVTGRRVGSGPANVSFTIVGNYGTSVTIDGMDDRDLDIAEDGTFSFTIGSVPSQDQGCHLNTAPHAKFLFVRDSFSDWNSQSPLELSIERLDPPAGREPLSIEEMAQRGAFRLVEEVPLYYWFQRLFSGKPVNQVEGPLASGPIGGLVTQAGNQAQLVLDEGEAAIVRFNRGGGSYAALELGAWWFKSIDAHERQSTLTFAQAVVGEDGWAECIVAPQDPGFANWVDTGGARHVLLFGRWQGLGTFAGDGKPDMTCRIVKLADIASRDDIAGGRIAAEGRKAQLAHRRAGWAHRFL